MATASNPLSDDATDIESLAHGVARINWKEELLGAAKSGALPIKDSFTFGPCNYAVGAALQSSLVSIDDLRVFLAGRPFAIEVTHSTAPAQHAATAAPVIPAKRREKKPSIETVALDYMRAEFNKGQFPSAAKFHKHLIEVAGRNDSPFEMGTGSNARKLFCPAASSFFDAGTLGKIWAKIRNA